MAPTLLGPMNLNYLLNTGNMVQKAIDFAHKKKIIWVFCPTALQKYHNNLTISQILRNGCLVVCFPVQPHSCVLSVACWQPPFTST